MTAESRPHKTTHTLTITLVLLLLSLTVFSQPGNKPPASKTQIVLLGTGTPSPDPDRSGPGTAIVVNGTPYLIDFGPGVVRRAAAAYQKGIKGLAVANLRIAFLTHLHSDRTVGYPDLILTPWAVGRTHPLEVYGPKGLKEMTEYILTAYREDIGIRLKDKEGVPGSAEGYKVQAHEINPGVVYKDENVTVKAFRVNHGDVPQAFGYRFETPDRTIVISGDTAPSQSIIDNCNGCDVLIHEAYSMVVTYKYVSPKYQEYRRKHHTSSLELAEIANKARPGLSGEGYQMAMAVSKDSSPRSERRRSRYSLRYLLHKLKSRKAEDIALHILVESEARVFYAIDKELQL